MYRETPHYPSHEWKPGTVEVAAQQTEKHSRKIKDHFAWDRETVSYDRNWVRGAHGDLLRQGTTQR